MMKFDSIDQMVAYMAEQTERANARLAPQQKAVTWGDHWARFDQKDFPIFGRVLTLEEALADTPDSEVGYEAKSLTENHHRGYMYGPCYSIITPEGEFGDTHRAHVWPIPETMFNAVREVAWDVKTLEVDLKMALMVHHTNWWQHEASLR